MICSKRCHHHHHSPMSSPISGQMPISMPPTPSLMNNASSIQLIKTGNTAATTSKDAVNLSFGATVFKIGNGINYFPNSSSVQIFQPGFYTVSFIILDKNTSAEKTATFTATLGLNGDTVATAKSDATAASGSDVVYATQIIYVDPQQKSGILTLSVQSTDTIIYSDYVMTVASIIPNLNNQNGQSGSNPVNTGGQQFGGAQQFNGGPQTGGGQQFSGGPQTGGGQQFSGGPQTGGAQQTGDAQQINGGQQFPPPKKPHC